MDAAGMTAKEVIARLGQISRDRALVKSAPISEAAKLKLLAELERSALELTASFKTDVDPAVQAGAAPQGRAKQ